MNHDMKRYKPRHKELIDYVDNNEAIEAQEGSTTLISLEDVDIIIDRVKKSVCERCLKEKELKVCHSCNSDIAEEFIHKCYCPECGVEWQTGL